MKSLRHGILRYIDSEDFNPQAEVRFTDIERLTDSDNVNQKTNATSIYQ